MIPYTTVMFDAMVYLITALLIVSFSAELRAPPTLSPQFSFLASLASYLGFFLFLAFSRRMPMILSQFIYRIRFILFLFIFASIHFFFLPQYFFFGGSKFFASLFSLFLFYFAKRQISKIYREGDEEEWRLLLPFALPISFFHLFDDLLRLSLDIFPKNYPNFFPSEFFSILIFFLLLVFFPFFAKKIWGCQPIEDKALLQSLEELCQRAKFSHGGLLVWSSMNHLLTAAIIGIFYPFRYVLFAQRMLKEFPEEEVKAILAHEIAHSKYKHLAFYPFLFFGSLLCFGYFASIFYPSIERFFLLEEALAPQSLLLTLSPLLFFFPLLTIFLLYFRFVYGFFSRNFERQADFHLFALGMSHKDLVSALRRAAFLSGIPIQAPNWHHHGIGERIRALEEAAQKPSLFWRQQRKVRLMLMGYFCFFFFSLFLFAAPYYPEQRFYQKINLFYEKTQKKMDRLINQAKVHDYASLMLKKYQPPGDERKLHTAFLKSLEKNASISIPGVLAFYSAQILSKSDQQVASVFFILKAWEEFDFPSYDSKIRLEFLKQSKIIYANLQDFRIDNILSEKLRERIDDEEQRKP